jgi:dienelactone hydrolase
LAFSSLYIEFENRAFPHKGSITMKRLGFALLALALLGWLVVEHDCLAGDKPQGKSPPDKRLGKAKNLNDKDFEFTPPKTKEEWEKRRQQVKEQVLVANGLWPMPKKTPLNAEIHGKIERDGYTVEKVYFESYPGFYVTGNLYRPSKLKVGDKAPGVLCPHGHWSNGRFYEASDAQVKADLNSGAEKTDAGARYPLQARCANLAMMGCVVFHYDMVGYADSKQIPHREGFKDPEAELRLQSFMGLQTWNSIRSLDFLLSLPEVDGSRIGVTGASGGGTQTFILCAVDDRPSVAFPAVMVSTEMQGGCVCENCDYLRLGTGNIELAGLFAPKPLAMSAADDWTKKIETNGYPDLKKLYQFYGAEDKVLAKAFTKFGHNYNQVAREMMYNWFNKHLKLGQPSPVTEKPFQPIPPKELLVFDADHPLPKNAKNVKELRDYLTAQQKEQLKALFPDDPAKLKELRKVVGTALRAMVNDSLPSAQEVQQGKEVLTQEDSNGGSWHSCHITRQGAGEAVPVKFIKSKEFNGSIVVWVHPDGIASLNKNGKLIPAAQDILKQGSAILVLDAFWTGELRDVVVQVKLDNVKLKARKLTAAKVQAALTKAKLGGKQLGNLSYQFSKQDAGHLVQSFGNTPVETDDGKKLEVRDVATVVELPSLPIDEGYAGFTFGYNRSLLANRVHDILTAVAYARKQDGVKKVHLVGFGEAGPWVVMARGLCGDAVAKTAVDMNQFRFQNILTMYDPMLQPGALKYGGTPAFAALCAPHPLYLYNTQGVDANGWIAAAYQSSGQGQAVRQETKKASMEDAVTWLLQ